MYEEVYVKITQKRENQRGREFWLPCNEKIELNLLRPTMKHFANNFLILMKILYNS